jgi:hypothetical protein
VREEKKRNKRHNKKRQRSDAAKRKLLVFVRQRKLGEYSGLLRSRTQTDSHDHNPHVLLLCCSVSHLFIVSSVLARWIMQAVLRYLATTEDGSLHTICTLSERSAISEPKVRRIASLLLTLGVLTLGSSPPPPMVVDGQVAHARSHARPHAHLNPVAAVSSSTVAAATRHHGGEAKAQPMRTDAGTTALLAGGGGCSRKDTRRAAERHAPVALVKQQLELEELQTEEETEDDNDPQCMDIDGGAGRVRAIEPEEMQLGRKRACLGGSSSSVQSEKRSRSTFSAAVAGTLAAETGVVAAGGCDEVSVLAKTTTQDVRHPQQLQRMQHKDLYTEHTDSYSKNRHQRKHKSTGKSKDKSKSKSKKRNHKTKESKVNMNTKDEKQRKVGKRGRRPITYRYCARRALQLHSLGAMARRYALSLGQCSLRSTSSEVYETEVSGHHHNYYSHTLSLSRTLIHSLTHTLSHACTLSLTHSVLP